MLGRMRVQNVVNLTVAKLARPVLSLGSGRECPVCGWTGARFVPFGAGANRRPEAMCPSCGCLERHRFVAMVIERVGGGHRTLHIAPEDTVVGLLRSVSDDYLSMDLRDGRAMVQGDLTSMEFADGSFSLVFCSHVLEHVPDDRAAMREIRRVLSPEGVALIAVPMSGLRTIEDLSVTDRSERIRRFGHPDHVRVYGEDVVTRLEDAGLIVETVIGGDLARDDIARAGVLADERIMLARPRGGQQAGSL